MWRSCGDYSVELHVVSSDHNKAGGSGGDEGEGLYALERQILAVSAIFIFSCIGFHFTLCWGILSYAKL